MVTGCGSSAPTARSSGIPARFPNHSVDEIHERIARASDTLRTFSAKARVTVQTPQRNQSFNAVVRQQRADSLLMRFRLFGIEGGRLLLTRDSVFFFDTRKAILQVGSTAAAQRIFPAPVSSDRLFENMLGLLAPDPSAPWTLEADSSLYYLSGPQDRERFTVDPSRWRVVRYVEETTSGDVVQQRLFSDFRRVEGLLVPYRIIFRRPMDDLSAVITYREIDLNPSALSFTLDVPPQVPRKPLR